MERKRYLIICKDCDERIERDEILQWCHVCGCNDLDNIDQVELDRIQKEQMEIINNVNK